MHMLSDQTVEPESNGGFVPILRKRVENQSVGDQNLFVLRYLDHIAFEFLEVRMPDVEGQDAGEGVKLIPLRLAVETVVRDLEPLRAFPDDYAPLSVGTRGGQRLKPVHGSANRLRLKPRRPYFRPGPRSP